MVTAIGVHCFVERGAINCNAVYVEAADAHSPDTAEQVVTFRGSRTAPVSRQLADLHDKLESEFSDRPVDVVVIRTADFHRSRGASAAADLRAHAEGVALLVGIRHSEASVAMRGVDVGAAYGADKKRAEARAKAVLPDGDREACSAAIAGLRTR